MTSTEASAMPLLNNSQTATALKPHKATALKVNSVQSRLQMPAATLSTLAAMTLAQLLRMQTAAHKQNLRVLMQLSSASYSVPTAAKVLVYLYVSNNSVLSKPCRV